MASWLWGAQSHGGQPAAVLREPTGHWGHWEPPGQVMVTNLSVSCQRGWGVGCPTCCWYFLSTHTWIHSYLHRADSNQDSKMSFKEIKSLLRMVNVDMNDMYAYRLFKVGTATSLTPALSSPDHYRRPFSFPSSCCGHRASCSRKATPGSPYLLPPPRLWGRDGSAGPGRPSSPSGRPQG